MSETSALRGTLTAEIANQATVEHRSRLKEAVEVRVLAETLDFQKSLAADLLQALGVGRHLDLEV